MTHRLATNYAKSYCNRTPIVKVIVENVVTCFLGHSVLLQITTHLFQISFPAVFLVAFGLLSLGRTKWALSLPTALHRSAT